MSADHHLHHDPPPMPMPSVGDYSPRHSAWEDTILRSVAEITQEQLWHGLSALYNSNEDLKEDAAALDPSSRLRNDEDGGAPTRAEILDGLLDTFMNGANRILDELTIIGNSHPILAVAIFAFHEVIKLDIARRENNKKVLVVVLEMQNMLGPMFQLRNLDQKYMPDRERQYHENRLKELVEVMTQDIKVCRSDITHFMNRKFIHKLVLAKGYERKFAAHIETFLRRRTELQSVISEYTAIGISAAHTTLAALGRKVDVADDKLDRIAAALFRALDTPRERDVFRFMQQHGGPEKCVGDLDLLPKLVAKAGQEPRTGAGAGAGAAAAATVINRAELEDLRKELAEALSEDLDAVLGKHFLRFEKVLRVQSNNIRRMAAHLESQGILMQTQSSKLGRILDTVTTIMVLEEGKYRPKAVKLKDPEIHRVWTQMNLNSVVKAKVFVLTFRDHIRLDRSTAGTPTPSVASLHEDDTNLQSFLSPTYADTHLESSHRALRPPMRLTESTRDFQTLQLAMNSIEAEESSGVLESPLELNDPNMGFDSFGLTPSTADAGDEDEDVSSERAGNIPKPTLSLTVTDTDPDAFHFASMQAARAHPQRRRSTMSSKVVGESDEWVLEYIDAAYVKPIVEAIDEDGSGFISAQEANRFALARPDGMSLLHWIAYWAAGWHINIMKYTKDIYAVLLQISDIAPHVLTTNRAYIDDYLDVPVMTRLDALLRSIRPIPSGARNDHNLVEIANTVAVLQMERLKTNLGDMGYVIESSLDAVTIAGGSSRVETWILPLILLLLQRHRDIIRLARTVVLDSREFHAHVQSLVSVFSVFDERIENLEAKFRQLHSDIDAQFHNFSYGMFFAAFKKNEFSTSDHALLSQSREPCYPGEFWTVSDHTPPDTSILSKPIGELFDPENPALELEPEPEAVAVAAVPPPVLGLADRVPHPMEGAWSGWFQPWEDVPHYIRPHRCVIYPIVDNNFVGKAEVFCGRVDVSGSVEPILPVKLESESGLEAQLQSQPGVSSSSAGGGSNESVNLKYKVHFDFVPEHGRYGQQCCWGVYDAERDVIEGTYSWSTPIRPLDPVSATPPQEWIIDDTNGNFGDTLSTTIEPSGESEFITSQIFSIPEWVSPATNEIAETNHIMDDTTALATLDQPSASNEHIDDKDLESNRVEVPTTSVTLHQDQQELTQTPEISQRVDTAMNDERHPHRENTATSTHDEPADILDRRKGDGRFILTRIPVHLLRFRYLLDGSGTPPCSHVWPLARKRWAFAIEAVLADTRTRMNSAKAFKEALAARRRWIYFGIRWYLTNPAMNPGSRWWYAYKGLSREEWEEYDQLESYVPPTNARLYELIANYMARREVHIAQVGRLICDVCNWGMIFHRHQCVYCKDDDLLLDSRDVDVCYDCIDMPLFRETSHTKSHSLLRCPYRIHKYEYKNIIAEARYVSERCKSMFREQEEWRTAASKSISRRNGKRKGPRNGRRLQAKRDPSPELDPILCSCCGKPVSLPCWACAVCSPYIFFCDSCDRRDAPITNWAVLYHSKKTHHILRIYDSVEIKGFHGGKGNDVGRQLEEINTTISSLEKKINKQLEEGKETKGVVDEMAKKVGISWTDEYSMSVGDAEEGDETLSVSFKAIGAASDSGKDVEVPVHVDSETTPTSQEPSTNGVGVYLGPNQTDVIRRLEMLEAKVEAKIDSLEARMEENLSGKINALEAKMDALLALVQTLASSSLVVENSNM